MSLFKGILCSSDKLTVILNFFLAKLEDLACFGNFRKPGSLQNFVKR